MRRVEEYLYHNTKEIEKRLSFESGGEHREVASKSKRAKWAD